MYEIDLACKWVEESKTSDAPFEVSQYFEAYFDFNFPFRPLLEFIRDCMRMKGSRVEIELPEYCKFEDFVSGSFIVQGRRIRIYFENSLAYMSFSSCNRGDLVMLLEASNGHRFLHVGYGLEDAD